MPAVDIISSGFRSQARYQARILKADRVPQLFVQHPVSDQTVAQMHEKADSVVDQVVAALSEPWSPPTDFEDATTLEPAAAECGS